MVEGQYVKFKASFEGTGIHKDFYYYQSTLHRITAVNDNKDTKWVFEADSLLWYEDSYEKILTEEENPEYFL